MKPSRSPAVSTTLAPLLKCSHLRVSRSRKRNPPVRSNFSDAPSNSPKHRARTDSASRQRWQRASPPATPTDAKLSRSSPPRSATCTGLGTVSSSVPCSAPPPRSSPWTHPATPRSSTSAPLTLSGQHIATDDQFWGQARRRRRPRPQRCSRRATTRRTRRPRLGHERRPSRHLRTRRNRSSSRARAHRYVSIPMFARVRHGPCASRGPR